MGPIGSPLAKIGIELTDSNYVLLCMRIMTRVAPKVWDALGDDDFVKCIHSMGCPRPWRSTYCDNDKPDDRCRLLLMTYSKNSCSKFTLDVNFIVKYTTVAEADNSFYCIMLS